jgi:AraC-like DNA-binding protein
MLSTYPPTGALAWQATTASRRQIHEHEAWEFVRVLAAGTRLTCGSTSCDMARGEVLVIPPRLPHAVHGSADGADPSIEILAVGSGLFDALEPADIGCAALRQAARLGLRFAPGRLAWPGKPPRDQAAVLAAVARCISSAAAQAAQAKPLVVAEGPRPSLRGHRHAARIQAFIDEQHAQPVGLRQCAEALGLSQATICRILRDHCGQGFTARLAARRLTNAERLLAEADLSMAEVAYQSGFGSVASFNRQFRQTHACSPGAWRERRRGDGGVSSRNGNPCTLSPIPTKWPSCKPLKLQT